MGKNAVIIYLIVAWSFSSISWLFSLGNISFSIGWMIDSLILLILPFIIIGLFLGKKEALIPIYIIGLYFLLISILSMAILKFFVWSIVLASLFDERKKFD
ncbi:MAG: hypothetical protein DRN66_02365 [Candidatus Nanohalarchaeota archaeon]|nr:MAG: hypothetical protein DRN66_02365 [Candidatus Nanohaloarchaeota archaeon]